MRKIKYIDRKKTRRLESELLENRLKSTPENRMETGQRLADEIDTLLDRGYRPRRYTLEFDYVSFNEPLIFQ
ncbi:MAG TPA: hypothetical protein DIV79_07945 [Opitutae bacterium]|nr:hypothetical protein [Opitutaceae bacterium]HCR29931.1 hypothetical protein [Opitutae bacterium]